MKEYPKHRTDVSVRIVDNETIVLDRQQGLIHQFNSTASYIWERCNGQSTLAVIAQQFMKEFSISFDTAETDTRRVVEQLEKLNLLE